MTMTNSISPIGVIRTPFKSKAECPVQGVSAQGALGRVEVYPEFQEGLLDIESFSHVYLLYQFHLAGEVKLVRTPFLDETRHGLFATRHPCRPNGIGLSIVRILGREGGVLSVQDVDMIDQSPLIDIKPYVPKFDARPDANNGWVEVDDFSLKPSGRE
jgi:tRNA-Thr(GGU) m(6)t(6)A37 methyltransferase TsaA